MRQRRPVGGQDRAEAEVAAEGVEIIERRPRRPRLGLEPAPAGQLQQGEQRVVAGVKGLLVRGVFQRAERPLAGRQRRGKAGANLRRQLREPGKRRALFAFGQRRRHWRRWLRLTAAEEGAQPAAQGPAGLGGAVAQHALGFEIVQPLRDLVEGLEEQVRHLGRERNPAGPNRIEKILGGMNDRGEGRDVEQARRALHRVHRAEQVVDDRGVVRRLLQREEAPARLLEKVAALGEELAQQRRRHRPAPAVISRTQACSSAGLTGLTRYRLAPAR